MTNSMRIFTISIVLVVSSCAAARMPAPDGEYLVGTTRIDLVDDSREEYYVSDPGAKRKISVQVWYPADKNESDQYDVYISDSLGRAMQEYMGIPSFVIGERRYSNSRIGVPVASGRDTYPIIIFNHGYGSYGGQSYSQMESLASHGFIVFSISHPYTSVLTQFADGTVCERARNPYWDDTKSMQKDIDQIGSWYKNHLERIRSEPLTEAKRGLLVELSESRMYSQLESDHGTWVSDTTFLIDSLESLNESPGILSQKMDIASVGIYGHSFGGSVASEVALRLPAMVKAGINLDGPCLIYGYQEPARLQVPFMFVYSTDLRLGNAVCEQAGLNDAYRLDSESDCYSVTMVGSAHHSFSDMTYIPFLKNSAMLGPIDPLRAGAVTGDLVLSFFKKYLTGSTTGFDHLQNYEELILEGPTAVPHTSL